MWNPLSSHKKVFIFTSCYNNHNSLIGISSILHLHTFEIIKKVCAKFNNNSNQLAPFIVKSLGIKTATFPLFVQPLDMFFCKALQSFHAILQPTDLQNLFNSFETFSHSNPLKTFQKNSKLVCLLKLLAWNLLKPFSNLFSKPFWLEKFLQPFFQNLLKNFENLIKTPCLCWNHLKTFLASFMLLHFLKNFLMSNMKTLSSHV